VRFSGVGQELPDIGKIDSGACLLQYEIVEIGRLIMTDTEISKTQKTDEVKREERRKLLVKLGMYSALIPVLAACNKKDDD
jgi:hypothetical protein